MVLESPSRTSTSINPCHSRNANITNQKRYSHCHLHAFANIQHEWFCFFVRSNFFLNWPQWGASMHQKLKCFDLNKFSWISVGSLGLWRWKEILCFHSRELLGMRIQDWKPLSITPSESSSKTLVFSNLIPLSLFAWWLKSLNVLSLRWWWTNVREKKMNKIDVMLDNISPKFPKISQHFSSFFLVVFFFLEVRGWNVSEAFLRNRKARPQKIPKRIQIELGQVLSTCRDTQKSDAEKSEMFIYIVSLGTPKSHWKNEGFQLLIIYYQYIGSCNP